ncbi:sodium:proton antiporter [Thermococcus sp. M39]|uniref:monovalent cation/H(+) antiporter subunit G n=1 Tax=Thermococcus sp. M39 TaxID=1638262 RepID=UPI00143CB1FB|nr:monovalent cation/H(+) antiporter subunit G [Thermococcus sp. M39]NJE07653.1 sodium:proton antiporter [Thermococcus sp. M39]
MTINEVIFVLGMIAIILGGIYDLIAAIGMLRFNDFYLRLHASTVGTIGGAALPTFGAGLVALVSPQLGELKYFIAGSAFTVAILILLTAPTGSHSLASTAYLGKIAKPQNLVVDHLKEDRGEKK